MTNWTIEPHDSLIARDGRPFTPDPGARAATLSFLFPSTTAGAFRTMVGLKRSAAFSDWQSLLHITVHGPLLVNLANDDAIADWFAPAPADAVAFKADEHITLRRLVPLTMPEGWNTDLAEKPGTPADLKPVGLPSPRVEKAVKTPQFWRWKQFEQWLREPETLEEQSPMSSSDLGLPGLPRDERVQIARDRTTRTARDEHLFSTQGLSFTLMENGHPLRLGLAILTPETVLATDSFVAPLGGERRLASWRASTQDFPQCPSAIADQIAHDRSCRLVLLTPAFFAQGYIPNWLVQPHHDVTPTLQAIAIDRPQVVSGWDLAKSKPKPSRRLAPAGTVLFLKLDGTPEAIQQWTNALWMQCVSDDEPSGDPNQCRNDGFGLAALGTWDGALRLMEVNHA